MQTPSRGQSYQDAAFRTYMLPPLRELASVVLVLVLCSCARPRPPHPPDCPVMLPETEEVPEVSYQANARDAELWLPTLTRLDCTDCDEWRWVIASGFVTMLDHLDEPVVLPEVDVGYRLILYGFSTYLMVRIDRSAGRSRLVVKVARGSRSERPALQTIRRRSRALSESEWQRVAQALRGYDFWDRPVFLRYEFPKRQPGEPIKAIPMGIYEYGAVLEGFDSSKRHMVSRPFGLEDSTDALVDLFWGLAGCGADEAEIAR